MTDAPLRDFPAIDWDDGYPTEDSLSRLHEVPPVSFGPEEAARYLRAELAKCAENCCASYNEEGAQNIMGRDCMHAHFSTGGWSGAEDLIDELLGKFWVASLHLQWNRGGHYVFELPEHADESPATTRDGCEGEAGATPKSTGDK